MNNMPKKLKFEDDDDEDEDEEEDEEDEEETPVPAPKKKVKKQLEGLQLQHGAEIFRVIDPLTEEVIAAGTTLEELKVELLIKILETSRECATNTR